MLNQVILVGKVKELIMAELNGKKMCNIKVKISRTYKNSEGEYEEFLLDNIYCYGNVADNVIKECRQQDVLGIKGYLDNEDGKIIVIAEKISYLKRSDNSNTRKE